MCRKAYECKLHIGKLDTDVKNKVLLDAANLLEQNDLELSADIIAEMTKKLREIAHLSDPIGEVMSMSKRPNGLIIGKRRVALGVVGVIFESQPNIITDAFGLCIKSGNCLILKGDVETLSTNKAIVNVLQQALKMNNVPTEALNLIDSTDESVTMEFMKMNSYVDVLIPRGGSELVHNVITNASIPVINTGVGNCHIYVDEFADLDMASKIINNAGESVLVHKSIAKHFEDVIGVHCVENIDEAIAYINKHNVSHSEVIITSDYDAAQKFLDEVDAACVYVNASTGFSDGAEFGFGAEIGVSTQKLHARGPMGLEALTSYKYIVYGNGQIHE